MVNAPDIRLVLARVVSIWDECRNNGSWVRKGSIRGSGAPHLKSWIICDPVMDAGFRY